MSIKPTLSVDDVSESEVVVQPGEPPLYTDSYKPVLLAWGIRVGDSHSNYASYKYQYVPVNEQWHYRATESVSNG